LTHPVLHTITRYQGNGIRRYQPYPRAKPAWAMAQAMAIINEKNQAFVWLEKIYLEHHDVLVLRKVSSFIENLLSDPRFTNLLRRLGFPQ
jgi:hypothetical protein